MMEDPVVELTGLHGGGGPFWRCHLGAGNLGAKTLWNVATDSWMRVGQVWLRFASFCLVSFGFVLLRLVLFRSVSFCFFA